MIRKMSRKKSRSRQTSALFDGQERPALWPTNVLIYKWKTSDTSKSDFFRIWYEICVDVKCDDTLIYFLNIISFICRVGSLVWNKKINCLIVGVYKYHSKSISNWILCNSSVINIKQQEQTHLWCNLYFCYQMTRVYCVSSVILPSCTRNESCVDILIFMTHCRFFRRSISIENPLHG